MCFKTNFNRDFWTVFIYSEMNYDMEYEYSAQLAGIY